MGGNFMRWASGCALGGLLVLASCGAPSDNTETPTIEASGPLEVKGLKTAAAFASVSDDTARAVAVFDEMAKVMLHPRCANCHPRSDIPTQGDDMHPHNPPVTRGFGMGAPGMECTACHGPANVTYASMEGSIPGAEPWLLAPRSMGWAGATNAELCAQIKDTELNGGRSLQDLITHNGQDHLVDWAWHPGEGRSPAPGDQATFGALTAAWVNAGAHCPS